MAAARLWIVSILTIFVSMGLTLIIKGQHNVLTMLQKNSDKVEQELKKLADHLTKEEFFKGSVEKLLAKEEQTLKGLEAEVAKLNAEVEERKNVNSACEAQKKTQKDELANTEKAHAEIEAKIKSESDAWNQERENLKAQLNNYSPICNYIKKDEVAQKLCGKAPDTASLIPLMTAAKQN